MTRSHEPKPRVACEIMPENLVAARAKSDRSALEMHTVRAIEPGLIRPSLNAGNIANPSSLAESISSALTAVGGRKRDVFAVIPDAAVRVLLMDFDTLPEKKTEAEPIIRFRLRKSIPFDAEQAALSFQRYSKNGTVRVLAAVMPREVLNEYEGVFRAAGYEPGFVLPSTLATLGAIRADRPTLLVKSDGNYVSVAIADQNELVFYRMLDSVVARSGTDIANDVYPSIVFFEDNYSAKIERIVLAALSQNDGLPEALLEQTGIRPEALDLGGRTGESLAGETLPDPALAGVAGVLA